MLVRLRSFLRGQVFGGFPYRREISRVRAEYDRERAKRKPPEETRIFREQLADLETWYLFQLAEKYHLPTPNSTSTTCRPPRTDFKMANLTRSADPNPRGSKGV